MHAGLLFVLELLLLLMLMLLLLSICGVVAPVTNAADSFQRLIRRLASTPKTATRGGRIVGCC